MGKMGCASLFGWLGHLSHPYLRLIASPCRVDKCSSRCDVAATAVSVSNKGPVVMRRFFLLHIVSVTSSTCINCSKDLNCEMNCFDRWQCGIGPALIASFYNRSECARRTWFPKVEREGLVGRYCSPKRRNRASNAICNQGHPLQVAIINEKRAPFPEWRGGQCGEEKGPTLPNASGCGKCTMMRRQERGK